MNPTLEQRAAQARARALVRAWQYRQRAHAQGLWFRLRRLLADASSAYVVTAEDAEVLAGEGFRAEPVGGELEPAKTILVVPADRVTRIASARPVPVRLGGELLAARHLVLTRFETAPSPPDASS